MVYSCGSYGYIPYLFSISDFSAPIFVCTYRAGHRHLPLHDTVSAPIFVCTYRLGAASHRAIYTVSAPIIVCTYRFRRLQVLRLITVSARTYRVYHITLK